MIIENLLKEENCLFLKSRTKSEVLHELIDKVENVRDRDGLVREIFYREQLMSTGIGQGIGIPHVRFSGIDEAQVIVGIKPEGIRDYVSLDDIPVKIVLLILVGADQHKEYLRILSLLVGRLKDPEISRSVYEAADSSAIKKALVGGSL